MRWVNVTAPSGPAASRMMSDACVRIPPRSASGTRPQKPRCPVDVENRYQWSGLSNRTGSARSSVRASTQPAAVNSPSTPASDSNGPAAPVVRASSICGGR
jgi:hypothetical protein